MQYETALSKPSHIQVWRQEEFDCASLQSDHTIYETITCQQENDVPISHKDPVKFRNLSSNESCIPSIRENTAKNDSSNFITDNSFNYILIPEQFTPLTNDNNSSNSSQMGPQKSSDFSNLNTLCQITASL